MIKNKIEALSSFVRTEWASVVLFLLLFAAVLLLGYVSLNFGTQVDEQMLIKRVQRSLQSSFFLPRAYNYPSLHYLIGLLGGIPELSELGFEGFYEPDARTETSYRFAEYTYRIRMRAIFFTVAAAAMAAAFLLVRAVSLNRWAALFSSAVIGFSWEYFYHARYIAPDCLMAVCVLWSMCAQYYVIRARNRPERLGAVVAASVFAGLAASAKYPGGLVFFVLLIAIALSHRPARLALGYRLRLAISAGFVTAGVFLVTTPGILVSPFAVAKDVLKEIEHYGSRGHHIYTVESGAEHLTRMLTYLANDGLSRWPLASWSTAVLAVWGMVYLIKERPRIGIWLSSLPVAYALYFSKQVVMFVRNYMVLLPFLAIFAGLGLWGVLALTRNRRVLRSAAALAAVLLVVLNFAALATAAYGVYTTDMEMPHIAMQRYILENPEVDIYLTSRCRSALFYEGTWKKPNLAAQPRAGGHSICFEDEVDPEEARSMGSERIDVIWRSPLPGQEAAVILASRLRANPRKRFFLSPGARALLAEAEDPNLGNVVASIGLCDKVVFVSGEYKRPPVNRANRYRVLWPKSVTFNYNYYASRIEPMRLVEADAKDPVLVAYLHKAKPQPLREERIEVWESFP